MHPIAVAAFLLLPWIGPAPDEPAVDDPPALPSPLDLDVDFAIAEVVAACDRGEVAEAERLTRALLDDLEPAGGPDEPIRIWCLEKLGYFAHIRNHLDEAVGHLDAAVAANRDYFGPRHAATARATIQLAAALHAQDPERAAGLYRDALAIQEEALGPDHPDVVESLIGLGTALLYLDRDDEARPLLERGRSILEARPGPAHELLGDVLIPLAGIHFREGEVEEAERLCRRAIELEEQVAVPDPLNHQGHLAYLASLIEERRAFDEARPFRERALAIAEDAFGPDHPLTLDAASDLGRNLALAGSFLKAHALFRRALDGYEATGRDEPELLIFLLTSLADAESELDRLDDAERTWLRALALQEQHFGPDHPGIEYTLRYLAWLCGQQGRIEEADGYLARVEALEAAGEASPWSPPPAIEPDDAPADPS